jgi:rhamnose utilization protein RhaD (predicted bifunctional aldolase and dehydrogenase)
MMMKQAIEANPDCDGIVLGGHGLFTWGETHRESYLNTITIIDQLGQFVNEHASARATKIFGGVGSCRAEIARSSRLSCCRILRGQVSSNRG